MKLQFVAMDSDLATHYKKQGPDAYGQPPQRTISEGGGNPCRHCMSDIPLGKEMLVLAHRPFTSKQPYAETGPILLCADECEPFGSRSDTPTAVAVRPNFLLRAYSTGEVIVEGTGKITATSDIKSYAENLLTRPDVASVHIRSSSNNCYFCKVEEA